MPDHTIEVELRGPLTPQQFDGLKQTLPQSWTFRGIQERIFIDYSTFLPDEGIRQRRRDIRLRTTDGVPEIIVKTGDSGSYGSRREYSVKLPAGNFDTMAQIFGQLGFTKGILGLRKRHIYIRGGCELLLIEVPGFGAFYEIEKMVGNDEAKAAAEAELHQTCQELGLRRFTDEEFHAFMEQLNETANDVFDYAQYHEGDLARRFHLPDAN